MGERRREKRETGRNLRINKVDANVLVLHKDFALLDLGHGQVGLVLEDVDTAGLLDDDAGHGLWDFGHCGIRMADFDGRAVLVMCAGGGVDVAMV